MTAKKPALGRGLDALMGGGSWNKPDLKQEGGELEAGVIGAIAAIPVGLIDANPYQPRKQFDEESLSELSESIKANGIITPLTVRKVGKRYQLISGERRLRAAKLANLEEVPAYIRMVSDNESLEMALVENIQREDLNAIDVALTYQALMDACHYNQEQLGQRVGKNRSTVANFLRLLKLPADIQLYLKDNKLSMGHARCLAGVESGEEQLKLAQEVIDNNLSVRQLEDLIRRNAQASSGGGHTTGRNTSPRTASLPQWCAESCKRLSEKIQTPVLIKPGKEGKGNLVISYSSEETLQKIFSLLNE